MDGRVECPEDHGTERERYERFYRDDLEAQLAALVERWRRETRHSGLRWVVDDIAVTIQIGVPQLSNRSAPRLVGDVPLQLADPVAASTRRDPGEGRFDPTGRRRAIRAILAGRPNPVSVDELAQELEGAGLDLPRARLHQLLGRMVEAGQIARPSRARYGRVSTAVEKPHNHGRVGDTAGRDGQAR